MGVGRPQKYSTEEERRAAQREQHRRYRERVKADPERAAEWNRRRTECSLSYYSTHPEMYKKHCLKQKL